MNNTDNIKHRCKELLNEWGYGNINVLTFDEADRKFRINEFRGKAKWVNISGTIAFDEDKTHIEDTDFQSSLYHELMHILYFKENNVKKHLKHESLNPITMAICILSEIYAEKKATQIFPNELEERYNKPINFSYSKLLLSSMSDEAHKNDDSFWEYVINPMFLILNHFAFFYEINPQARFPVKNNEAPIIALFNWIIVEIMPLPADELLNEDIISKTINKTKEIDCLIRE